MLGEQGMLNMLGQGSTVIDTTTSSVALIQQLVALAEKNGVHYLEAPLTNAVDFAALGRLSIFVGGSLTAFETNKPIFEVIGEKIFHVGKAGNGATVKLLTNLLWFVSAATIGEALMLGAKADIPLTLFGRRSSRVLATVGSQSMMCLQYLRATMTPVFHWPCVVKTWD